MTPERKAELRESPCPFCPEKKELLDALDAAEARVRELEGHRKALRRCLSDLAVIAGVALPEAVQAAMEAL